MELADDDMGPGSSNSPSESQLVQSNNRANINGLKYFRHLHVIMEKLEPKIQSEEEASAPSFTGV